jgi:hypothetical protein
MYSEVESNTNVIVYGCKYIDKLIVSAFVRHVFVRYDFSVMHESVYE